MAAELGDKIAGADNGLFKIDRCPLARFSLPFPGMILSLPLTRRALPFLKAFGARERVMFLATSALVLGFFLSLNVKATVPLSDREAHSYYQMLTEAFLSGRTYLSLEPDPRLKALADPWAGAQGVPRAHDATYYNGKYYLYFGMGPVLSLMAPWR